jgi:hypothetical protein
VYNNQLRDVKEIKTTLSD